jgi:PadR family transcriptional regulator, regulatory protein PadR
MRGHNRHGFGGGRRRGRNLMRPTLLLLMLQGPAHGYDLTERMGKFGVKDIDPSLIYRALRGMEEDGLVTSAWDEQDTQGPPRRVYTLSAEGQEALAYYMDELRVTSSQINQLIETYQQHRPGSESHPPVKGDV